MKPTHHRIARHHLTLLAAGLAALLGGCAGPTAAPATRPVNLSVMDLPANSFARQVPIDLKLPDGDSVADLHLAGGRLYVMTRQNLAYGLTPGGTPTFVRRIAAEGETVYPPVIASATAGATGSDATSDATAAAPDAEVVFPTAAGLHVYRPDGTPVRTVDTQYSVRTHIASGLGLIYGGIDTPRGGRLGAFDPGRDFAALRWSVQQGALRAGPAFYGRVVYFGTIDGRVYAVSPDRTTPWAGLPDKSFQTDAEIVADLAADDYAVYVAGTDKKLYAIDRATGKVRWYYFAQTPLTDAPIVTADAVFQIVPGKGIVKIEKVKGDLYRTPLWTAPDVTQYVSADATNVYAKKSDGELVALDQSTGKVKFTVALPFDRLYATNLGDPTIYSADKLGRVTIIKPVLKAGQVGLPLMAKN